jgi:hypothetical protein
MHGHWHDALLLEALATEYRSSLGRLERHSGLLAAIRAGGAGFRAHRRSPGGALRFAKLASLRIIPELLVVKEKLLTGGEYEFIPAIDTLENLIYELHLAFPSPAAEKPQPPAQSFHSYGEMKRLIVANYIGQLM